MKNIAIINKINNYYLNFGLQLLFYNRVLHKIKFLWNYYTRKINLRMKRIINKRKRSFERFTGYTWTDFLNSITISSLFLLLFKLFFSFFYIKLSVLTILFLFMFFLISSLILNIYESFNLFLIYCLKKLLWPRFYESFEDDGLPLEELDQGALDALGLKPHLLWFYNFNEKILQSLIFFRLCFFCEPLLFNFLKFILLTFFLYDYNLTLAYLVSFIFIISRFVFFLTDYNYNEFTRILIERKIINNIQEKIKPTNVNVIATTFWAIRILAYDEMHKEAIKMKDLHLLDGLYLQYLKTKTIDNLNLWQKMELKTISPHKYSKIFFLTLIVSLFYLWATNIFGNYFKDISCLMFVALKTTKNYPVVIKNGYTPKKISKTVLEDKFKKGKEGHLTAESYLPLSNGNILIKQNAFTSQPNAVNAIRKPFLYTKKIENPVITYQKTGSVLYYEQHLSLFSHSSEMPLQDFYKYYNQRKLIIQHQFNPQQLMQIEDICENQTHIIDYNIFPYLWPQLVKKYVFIPFCTI